jgi:hypothetical protein
MNKTDKQFPLYKVIIYSLIGFVIHTPFLCVIIFYALYMYRVINGGAF